MSERPRFFIFDFDHVLRAVSWEEYIEWLVDRVDIHVAQEMVNDKWWVSTVFLGVDHRYLGEGPPILFETMVFDVHGKAHGQRRCSTWAEAEAQHAEIVTEMKRSHLKVVK